MAFVHNLDVITRMLEPIVENVEETVGIVHGHKF